MTIPDAPWIIEACRNGMPEAEETFCPICHEECEQIFFRKSDKADVLGCENCIDWEPSDCWEE